MMLQTKYQGSKPCGFRQENFTFCPIEAYIKLVITRAGHFWPQGYNLNKLGRGPVGVMLNINSLGLLVSDKKIFPRFPKISLCKIFDPRGGAISGPRDNI